MHRLMLSLLFTLSLMLPVSVDAAVASDPPNSQQLYHYRLLAFGYVAVVQLLLIIVLLHNHFRSKAVAEELRHKEEEARKSEEKFSKVFRQSPVALTLTTAERQRYIDVNEAYERLTGFHRDEVVGRTVLDIGLWVDENERSELIEDLHAKGHLRDAEFRFRKKDGGIRVGQASAELIEIENEECVLGFITDITDRKQAEQALMESERRFRLMADSAPVLMWLTDPDKLCTDVNREWLMFTGRTLQQEMGKGWLDSIHPADERAFLAVYTSEFNRRRSFTIEHRLRRFDGEFCWMRNNGVPRFQGDSTFAGYIGCCVDITEEREAKAVRAEFGGRLIHAQEEE